LEEFVSSDERQLDQKRGAKNLLESIRIRRKGHSNKKELIKGLFGGFISISDKSRLSWALKTIFGKKQIKLN